MHARERERVGLQEKVKRGELLVFLFEKKGEDPPLSELVEHHHPKQRRPKCKKQHHRVWPSSMPAIAPISLVISPHCNLSLSLSLSLKMKETFFLNLFISLTWRKKETKK